MINFFKNLYKMLFSESIGVYSEKLSKYDISKLDNISVYKTNKLINIIQSLPRGNNLVERIKIKEGLDE